MMSLKRILFYMIQKASFGRIFWNRGKGIYLTYDDGPNENTHRLLDILNRSNIQATFFILGKEIEENDSTFIRVIEDGHSIGNHTYSHFKFAGNTADFLRDVQKTELEFNKYGIHSNKLIRIPYGVINFRLLLVLLLKGYRIAFWNKDTKDFELSRGIVPKINFDVDQIKNGDIILMHDHSDYAIKFTEEIVRRHKTKNFIGL